MKILRRRNKVFSKKNEGDETKLKVLDKLGVWNYKLSGKNGRERTRRYLQGKRDSPLDPKASAIQGALTGSVLALPAWDTPISALVDKKYKKAVVLSAGGAAINPMINRGAGYLNKKKLKKNPHANDRSLDLLDVADGKMTKSEYAKKWYSRVDMDTDEKIYSVLMTEDELALFSDILKDNKKELTAAAIGSGLIGGEAALSNKNSRIALRKGLRKLGKKKIIQDYNRSLVGSGVRVVDITPGPKMRKEILSKAKNTEKLINKGSKGLKYIGGALVLGSAAKALNSAMKKRDKN